MESPNHNPDGPTTMKASEFKARCLRLMDEVAASATALAGHRLMTADQRILSWPGRLCRLDAGE